MKVAGCVFQKKFIEENNENEFIATYKGKRFYISNDHGFGEPEYEHLTRFNIDVTDIATGWYDVTTWEDFHSIRDAIHYALKNSLLL